MRFMSNFHFLPRENNKKGDEASGCFSCCRMTYCYAVSVMQAFKSNSKIIFNLSSVAVRVPSSAHLAD